MELLLKAQKCIKKDKIEKAEKFFIEHFDLKEMEATNVKSLSEQCNRKYGVGNFKITCYMTVAMHSELKPTIVSKIDGRTHYVLIKGEVL